MTKTSGSRAVQIAPSLLSADFLNLATALRQISPAQPDWLHVDVMDGHFVPNLTIGPPLIRALAAATEIPLDVHLMIDNPAYQLDWYLDSGAELLTVPLEYAGGAQRAALAPGFSQSLLELNYPERIDDLIERVHQAGCRIGLSLNPGTPAELALPFLDRLDLVLIMSVHPGFGGQNFIADALEKLRLISRLAAAQELDLLVEVDGGINLETAAAAVRCGANLLVAGQAIFGEPDPVAALTALRAVALAALD